MVRQFLSDLCYQEFKKSVADKFAGARSCCCKKWNGVGSQGHHTQCGFWFVVLKAITWKLNNFKFSQGLLTITAMYGPYTKPQTPGLLLNSCLSDKLSSRAKDGNTLRCCAAVVESVYPTHVHTAQTLWNEIKRSIELSLNVPCYMFHSTWSSLKTVVPFLFSAVRVFHWKFAKRKQKGERAINT